MAAHRSWRAAMSRFNTPEEVRAWAESQALGSILRAQYLGHDLNPFCTPGARNDWQRGYNGSLAFSWEVQGLPWCTMYQRGAAVRRLLDQQRGKA